MTPARSTDDVIDASREIARRFRARVGTSLDDIVEREGQPIVPVVDAVEREPRTIGLSELVRRVRSLRAHAGYVVRECNELLADLGADDVSNVMRQISGGTFDDIGRAVASQRVDAGPNDGTFDTQDRHEGRSKRGKRQ